MGESSIASASQLCVNGRFVLPLSEYVYPRSFPYPPLRLLFSENKFAKSDAQCLDRNARSRFPVMHHGNSRTPCSELSLGAEPVCTHCRSSPPSRSTSERASAAPEADGMADWLHPAAEERWATGYAVNMLFSRCRAKQRRTSPNSLYRFGDLDWLCMSTGPW